MERAAISLDLRLFGLFLQSLFDFVIHFLFCSKRGLDRLIINGNDRILKGELLCSIFRKLLIIFSLTLLCDIDEILTITQ